MNNDSVTVGTTVSVGATVCNVKKVKLIEVINSLLNSIDSDDDIEKAIIEIDYSKE